jgi:hypothetical protein
MKLTIEGTPQELSSLAIEPLKTIITNILNQHQDAVVWKRPMGELPRPKIFGFAGLVFHNGGKHAFSFPAAL